MIIVDWTFYLNLLNLVPLHFYKHVRATLCRYLVIVWWLYALLCSREGYSKQLFSVPLEKAF